MHKEKAKRIIEERVSESVSSPATVETEVFDEIFGVHKWGVPKGYGLGVKNIGHKGRRFSVKNLVDEELHQLKSQVHDLEEKVKHLMAQNEFFIQMFAQNNNGPTMNFMQNISGMPHLSQRSNNVCISFF